MHKKLAADLTSLAHSILQMKNKEDVFALKAKAHSVYEKLALLAYVEEYLNNTPNATSSKETLIASIVAAEENNKIETPVPSLEITAKEEIIEDNTSIEDTKTPLVSLEEEITDTIVTEEQITEDNSPVKETTTPLLPLEEVTSSINSENKKNEDTSIEEIPFDETHLTENELQEIASLNVADTTEEKTNFTDAEISEQPFDELEKILFGEDDIKEVSSLIEDIKKPVDTQEETNANDSKEPEEETKTTINTPTLKVVREEEDLSDKKNASKKLTLEEELEGTISVDVIANLFEKVPPTKKTLNDRLFNNSLKIDLNDRIAFVKNLFEGNQEDFNRVVSQLNTIKSEKEAKHFISKMVKPDYDWSTKEAYEARLLEIIERRFN